MRALGLIVLAVVTALSGAAPAGAIDRDVVTREALAAVEAAGLDALSGLARDGLVDLLLQRGDCAGVRRALGAAAPDSICWCAARASPPGVHACWS